MLAGRTPFPSQRLLFIPLWQDASGVMGIDPQPENGDLITQFYPYREFAGRTWRRGTVPLWNPHVSSGAPFQADFLSAVFAPATLLHALLPSWLAWGLGFWLRTALAGTFTAWFLRWLGASWPGALSAGIAYAFGGFVLAWQGWPQTDTAVWLPLMFLALGRLRDRRSGRDVALAALAFAMPVLSGHPGIALYLWCAAVAFGMFLALAPVPGEAPAARRRFASMASGAVALALAVAAVQVLPSMEWVKETRRGSTESNVGLWARPPGEIVSFLCRDALTNPNSAGILVPEAVTYSGALTAVAAFLAALSARRRYALFFGLLLLLALQVIYGWGPMFWVSSRAPGISAFNNWRVIVIACFALSVLAGLGVTAAQDCARARAPSRCWLVLGLALLVCAAGVWSLRQQTILAGRVPRDRWHAPSGSAALIVLSAALLSPLAVRRLGERAWGAGVVVLLGADMLAFGHGHVPFARREHVFPEPPLLSALKARDAGVYRVAALGPVMRANTSMVHAVDSPVGYGYALRRTLEVLAPVTEGKLAPSLHADWLQPGGHRLVDLMNVEYLLVYAGWPDLVARLRAQPERFEEVLSSERGYIAVFRNKRALARAFLVGAEGVELVRDDAAALARLASAAFDPGRSVIVPEPPAWTTGGDAAGEPEPVRMMRVGVNGASMETSAPRRSVLVYTDTWYPGWRVFVDGAERPLLRVDHTFKGVALEPGLHQVAFEFDPWRFRWGALISIAGVLGAVALAIPRRRPHGSNGVSAPGGLSD